MDWTKIPTTLISKRYTDYEIASIVKFQLIWAMNEEQPDKKTALRYMTAKQYDTAMTYLDSLSARVNDDVSSVVRKRSVEKIRYNKNKDLSKNLTADSQQNVGSLTEQIRLDKIREDKKKEIYKEDFLKFWELYPKQRVGNKEKAQRAFNRVLNEKRATIEKLMDSVQKYANSKEVERGYAKGCEAWLNDDRFNREYEQKEPEEEYKYWL